MSVYAFTVHSSCSIDAPRSARITGSAVETTRLSSTTMKSATEVIANVQSVLRLRLHPIRLLPVVSDHLPHASKKRAPQLAVLQPSISRVAPRRRVLVEPHRGDDVQQHPLGEEPRAPSSRRRAGDPLDVARRGRRSRCARPRGSRGPRRPRRPAAAAGARSRSLDQLARRPRPSPERLLARLPSAARCEGLERPPEAARVGGEVELLLRAEEPEEVRLRDAGAPWRSRRSTRRGGPCAANSSRAASSTSSRRSSAVCLVPSSLMEVS